LFRLAWFPTVRGVDSFLAGPGWAGGNTEILDSMKLSPE
jgi:hypothetical protein